MIAFRNVSPAFPFDVDAIQNSGGSGLPDPPSITPVTDNSMIVAVGFLDDESQVMKYHQSSNWIYNGNKSG